MKRENEEIITRCPIGFATMMYLFATIVVVAETGYQQRNGSEFSYSYLLWLVPFVLLALYYLVTRWERIVEYNTERSIFRKIFFWCVYAIYVSGGLSISYVHIIQQLHNKVPCNYKHEPLELPLAVLFLLKKSINK